MVAGVITASTHWREIGDCTAGAWRMAILDAGGPELLAARACWEAARPHSAILLNTLRAESSFGTRRNRNDPALTKNPFSLRRYNEDGTIDSANEDNPNGYLHFASWADGVRAARLRITDPGSFAAQTYGAKNPYPATVTLADLIAAFSPPPWNDTESIIRASVAYLNVIAKEQTPMPTVTFGRVPHPAHRKEIANKSRPGQGYDLVSPRQNVGMTWHEWMGYYIPGFFSCPNGERCSNALVDYAILKDGTIIMLNDPRGTRSPHASGGGVGLPGGLEGDGPAFVAKFGVGAINARTVSVEIVKLDGEQYTQKQIDAAAALAAYWHDQDGQRWDEHPYTSKYGIVTSFLHYEFGTTNCGKGELDDISKVQAATKGVMRKYQEGGSDVPVPPDVPPLPQPEIPGGLTLAQAKERFGTVTKHHPDGTTTTGGFDPNGVISLAWAHRAAAEKVWPKIEDWYVLKDSGEPFQIVTFANDWRLAQVSERAGWNWVAFTAVDQYSKGD